MECNKGTVLQQPLNPSKKPRLDVPWKDEREEELWFSHMNKVREWHHTQAICDNAMNILIEKTGGLRESSIEDEAVTMAIRSYGLTCGTQNFAYRVDRAQIETLLQCPNTSGFDNASRDDILSQAVTVAIRKKGLGAIDR